MRSASAAVLPDRALVLSVFVVASCGLAYELIAGALSSYLLGDSILQFSSIIGCYLFAMGIGSHLSRYVRDEDTLTRFVDIEMLVGVIGGVSAAALFLVFAWLSAPFRTVLYALVLVLGILVGMEIPLVMRIFNARQTEFKELVSRVLTFDYLGALVVSLLFPLVLAPRLGLSRTGFLFGMSNLAVAIWTTWIFRHEVKNARQRVLAASMLLCLLAGGFAVGEKLTYIAEKGLYGDEIIYARTTPYQRLVVTRWKDDLRLYINGNLQFSSRDEYRYHEGLVHPLMQASPWAQSVLILGGGDGLALREVLRYPNIKHVTLVDLDHAMTDLFSTSDTLRALNHNSFHDPRVTIINADAGRWLEQSTGVFDAVIVDFPDPSSFGLGKLYSVPVYRLLAHHLAENGYAVIQSTSPYFAPHAYWCIDATLREAGFNTWPYHLYVPSFGEWGFVLASKRRDFTPPTSYRLPMQYLNAATTQEMFTFPPDMKRIPVEPNHLNNQSLVRYFEQDWDQVIR
ncbi:polyamine aminopropyltransferase [Silvimonas iriomotensis]|uniref:Polyamine aminopropyltransferase n=1 Tax=Silvimonas iriomotensis TaxID=449662 RepID=A0ABQ2PEU4_9NEIS|nr:polyamine aminopropyltransferase [Silvimonas iriomotensis]GGP23811.1 polyamine aminopropyltransferase 1 [Silvimonas iriomotensis]